MPKKVNVIMPAYNGEKYIGEEIESILNQTYPLIDIYIRDDGSKDNTVSVIKNFIGSEPEGKKIHLLEGERENAGYVKNIFETLRLSGEADYYAFSDQDDYWLPEKIEKQVTLLESKGTDEPALSFTAFHVCDDKLNFMRESVPNKKEPHLSDCIYDYIVLAFNTMINRALYEEFFQRLPKDGYPHYPDHFLSMIAAAHRRLYYIDTPLVNYRRQEEAASYFNKNKFAHILWQVKNVLFGDEPKYIRKELTDFYFLYKDVMAEEDEKFMQPYAVRNFSHYFKKLFSGTKLRRSSSDQAALKVMFLLGKL